MTDQRDEYDDIDAMNASTIVHGYDGVGPGGVKTSMHALKHAIDNKRIATPGMIFGIQYHAFLLEPDDFDSRFKVVPDFGKHLSNVDSKGNRSTSSATTWAKQQKAAFYEECSANGVNLIVDKERAMAERKLERCRSIANGLRRSQKAMEIIEECDREITLTGEIDGVAFKGRLDLCHPKGLYFADIKGCVSASESAFGSKQCSLNIDIKLAVYRELMEQTFRRTPYVDLIAVESDGCHDVAVYRVPDDLIDFGRLKLTALLRDYKKALATNRWPGKQEPFSGEAPQMYVPNWAMPDEDLALEIAGNFYE